MAKRSDLLLSIADTTADYREGDLTSPTPEHVERWVNQFEEAVQFPILREMDHVLKKTYFSRKETRKFLAGLVKNKKLVGEDPCTFWKGVKFLDIQGGGASQKEMIALFSKILERECGFTIEDCGVEPRVFLYLDDAIFTGNRVRRDIEAWIKDNAPEDAKLHVVVIANHEGSYYHRGKISEATKAAGKKIEVTWWCAVGFEDRKTYTDNSDVLRPVVIPDDEIVLAYVASMSHKPHLRNEGNVGSKGIFSSDAGRQLLEQEFLKAGVRIKNACPNLGVSQRPLGHTSLEALGFGSMIVTFRNCPNNAPLVLWVGEPWYPLFPRTTNSDTSMRRFMAMLAQEAD